MSMKFDPIAFRNERVAATDNGKAIREHLRPTKPKMYNVQEWYGKRHVSTLIWNVPYALAKFKKRVFEQDRKYAKGTYFKIVPSDK